MEPEAGRTDPTLAQDQLAQDQLALDILLFFCLNSKHDHKPCNRLVCLIDAFIARLLHQMKALQPKLIEETSKLPFTQYAIKDRWAVMTIIQSASLCKDSSQLISRSVAIMTNFEYKNTEIHELVHSALMTAFLMARNDVNATNMVHPVCQDCYRFHVDWRNQFLRNEKPSSDE